MNYPAVDRLFEHYGDATAGCALLIVRSGEQIASGAYGMADLERGVPLTTSSRFNLGSLSKQFTALAVLLLEEDGALSLDDEVRTHLPELPDYGTAITLRHLLHHTSGLRGTYPELLMLGGWRLTDHITQDDCLRLIFDQRELSFEPGSEHLYVNANYVLLAETVARVSGMTLGEFSKERIFDPLGMEDTLVMDDVELVIPGRAVGYFEDDGEWHNLPLTDTALGSTNVYSTADDMIRWMVNLETAGVGGGAVMERMLEPGTLANGTVLGYAGGLQVGPGASYRGRPAVEHGGQHGGYCTSMYWFPEDDLGIVLLFNHFVFDSRERLLRVADLFLEDLETEAAPVSIEDRRITMDAADLEALAGVFYDPTRRAVREVPFVEGSLRYMGLSLVPVGPGEFTFAEAPTVGVRLDDRGVTLETSDRPYVYERVEAVTPGAGDLMAYAGRYESRELGVVWTIEPHEGGLRVGRPKHVATFPRPLFADAFVDDWTPILGFPMEYLIEFERNDGGEVSGFRVSGTRARGIWFERIDE